MLKKRQVDAAFSKNKTDIMRVFTKSDAQLSDLVTAGFPARIPGNLEQRFAELEAEHAELLQFEQRELSIDV